MRESLLIILSVKKSSLGRFWPNEAAAPWRWVVKSGLFSLFRDIAAARGVASVVWFFVACYRIEYREHMRCNIVQRYLLYLSRSSD